jgi:hypothetical protein
VGSSPTPHIGLFALNRAHRPLCIFIPRRAIRFERGTGVCLRLEEKPLERPSHFDAALGIGHLGLLLKPLASILLWLNNDGVHLKM